MQFINIIQEQLSHSSSIKWMLEWKEVTVLGELIYNDQDSIIRTRGRQSFNKIHGDDGPGRVRNWERL
jgi:hypothetical protein